MIFLLFRSSPKPGKQDEQRHPLPLLSGLLPVPPPQTSGRGQVGQLGLQLRSVSSLYLGEKRGRNYNTLFSHMEASLYWGFIAQFDRSYHCSGPSERNNKTGGATAVTGPGSDLANKSFNSSLSSRHNGSRLNLPGLYLSVTRYVDSYS